MGPIISDRFSAASHVATRSILDEDAVVAPQLEPVAIADESDNGELAPDIDVFEEELLEIEAEATAI